MLQALHNHSFAAPPDLLHAGVTVVAQLTHLRHEPVAFRSPRFSDALLSSSLSRLDSKTSESSAFSFSLSSTLAPAGLFPAGIAAASSNSTRSAQLAASSRLLRAFAKVELEHYGWVAVPHPKAIPLSLTLRRCTPQWLVAVRPKVPTVAFAADLRAVAPARARIVAEKYCASLLHRNIAIVPSTRHSPAVR